jgi:predicted RNA binding protein YcfA (HicA-like mRNA interferase family)
LTRPPQVSGRELVVALQRQGYALTHVRGSHHYLRKPDVAALVVVPVHGNHPLPKGTLRSILRQAGLTVDDLKDIL